MKYMDVTALNSKRIIVTNEYSELTQLKKVYSITNEIYWSNSTQKGLLSQMKYMYVEVRQLIKDYCDKWNTLK